MTESSRVDILVKTGADGSSTHPDHLHALAIEVRHNLQYQHNWKDLSIHTHSPTNTSRLLSRPLVSGVPPHRVYVHPDEQIQLIKAGIKDEDVPPEREWVLPSHLREKWSLRRFAEVFDAIDAVPPGDDKPAIASNPWRNVKRLLLATVDNDSTVTYYIVHDGIVKPRQN